MEAIVVIKVWEVVTLQIIAFYFIYDILTFLYLVKFKLVVIVLLVVAAHAPITAVVICYIISGV